MMSADPVLDWNQVLIDTIRNDSTLPGPTWGSRNMAMVHAAIFDAMNSVARAYQPYLVDVVAEPGTNADAAAVQAAYRVLVELYPGQQAALAWARQQSLGEIPDGQAEDLGVALGDYVGWTIVTARAGDHSGDDVPYTPSSDPGRWRPTPDDYRPALGPGWGNVTPFVMQSADQFMPPAPPALSSQEYADAFNEVRLLGEKDSPFRTAEQTEIGIFWGYDVGGLGPPPILYNQIVRSISTIEGLTPLENARLFALVNLAMGDAGVACWEAKYVYDLWRPVTGIREAVTDGNPLTEADPDWEPLGAPAPDPFTPPFPAYPSGHATFGAALFGVLARYFGTDEYAFQVQSDELPGVVRSYDRFSDAAEENGTSRIYLGIHWNFDSTEGQALGYQIADYVWANALVPLPPCISESTFALYDPAWATMYERYTHESGVADNTFSYGPPYSGWKPVAGDWNGDGVDSLGLYDPQTATFYVRNSNDTGVADASFTYGPAGSGWIPLSGDWDGDGVDGVGLYDPVTGVFYLRNELSTGYADRAFVYGPGGAYVPLAGDWDGDGRDGIGVYDPGSALFFLRDECEPGFADLAFLYGAAGQGWNPMIGDWYGDGVDSIGVYDPWTATAWLREDNSTGYADVGFTFGPNESGWIPLAGDWDGPRQEHLTRAGGDNPAGPAAPALDGTELDGAIDAAIHRWLAAGLPESWAQVLRDQQVYLLDLPAGLLGMTAGGSTWLDATAAGSGWFIDPTPDADEEFEFGGNEGITRPGSPAAGRIDLVTVLAHEFGHLLGFDHDAADGPLTLMASSLAEGTRRNPAIPSVDAAFGTEEWWEVE
jgi:hypothetical protein